jgi:putative transposase
MDLKAICKTATTEEAEVRFLRVAARWHLRYPLIGKSWRVNWSRAIPMFGRSGEIRRAVYTTNAIESLNISLPER